MIKTKEAFLKGRFLSSQSGLFENFSDCSNGWIKAGPPKKPLLF